MTTGKACPGISLRIYVMPVKEQIGDDIGGKCALFLEKLSRRVEAVLGFFLRVGLPVLRGSCEHYSNTLGSFSSKVGEAGTFLSPYRVKCALVLANPWSPSLRPKTQTRREAPILILKPALLSSDFPHMKRISISKN